MTLTDAIVQAKSWDKDALGILYDASYDQVYRMIFHRTLDTTITEDIISGVYMKVIKGIGKFEWNSEWEYFSWILRIAYTTLIDSVRSDRPTDSIDDIDWEPSISTDTGKEVDHRDKLSEVLSYMNSFSRRDRIILTMRIWDDLSYEEISSITGVSVSNSKKIVSRSLEKISANISPLAFLVFLTAHVIIR